MNEEKKPTKDRGLFKRKDSPYWWISYKDENGKVIRTPTYHVYDLYKNHQGAKSVRVAADAMRSPFSR